MEEVKLSKDLVPVSGSYRVLGINEYPGIGRVMTRASGVSAAFRYNVSKISGEGPEGDNTIYELEALPPSVQEEIFNCYYLSGKTKGANGLAWEKMDGLLPAVVQNADTGEVLMLAYVSQEALQVTREKGYATFYSRSKKGLWTKGMTSGNTMKMEEILYDCDGDALLYRVRPNGPACHTGERTCFYRRLQELK
ncbi:MAG: phosphoribosyl-AMP cyclohydrolase [Candidatus Aenigmatarchaeota archaeon]